MIIRGQEFHSIIQNIFDEVFGYLQSEQIQVNCPRCQEREGLTHPDGKFNLEINTAKRIFKCWKCDEPKFSGSLGKLIKLYGSHVDYEIYKSYTGIFNEYNSFEENEFIEIKLPEEMILFSKMETGNPEHFEAYNYLVNERKINRDIILKYRLGFCITGKYAKRIIIPSYDKNGDINYFVGRYYGNDPKIKKKIPYLNPRADKDKIIFNEGLINLDSIVFLVEGVFDMFRLPNSIPLLGKTISSTLFYKLKEHKPKIIILLDPDAYKNCIDLYYTLNTIYFEYEERVKIVKLPTMEDIDEYYINHGIDKILGTIRNVRNLTIDDYFINKLQKPYENGKTGRYRTNTKNFEWKHSSTGNTLQ